ncbi:TIGR01777 family oxidoreductase [Lederbergia sp. NSJ-179]|uniref:TIGR01777 family oxidoreductase n=1 Tax=Lederbergia sp. NSJ-179 TaxID=2931402 RepID=UPI001FD31F0A|nr:TIGR01777 family oxidoreductase [Lederbergia sp. NSJ-179]MCJ7842160.1 TIGR01777 family oxidoreductase [Lederbergia sp. NSJ-179]
MHIVIAGGSGFVGQALKQRLLNEGNQVTILTRNPSKFESSERLQYVEWLTHNSQPEIQVEKVDAFVNLAGESINGLRWTKAKKERIIQSRITATKEVLRIIENLHPKPKVLVNASAIGYYGMSETETFTEEAHSNAHDFLATVVKKWEELASTAEKWGVRTVYARFGIVLGKKGGALPFMSLPYKLGVGGTIGSGKQWVSWVHVADVAGLISYAIEQSDIQGPLNVTAPEPKRMADFGKMIGYVLHRPHWFPVPSFAMKALLGEMSEMLLCGQRAIPEKALTSSYKFQYPDLEAALKDIFA